MVQLLMLPMLAPANTAWVFDEIFVDDSDGMLVVVVLVVFSDAALLAGGFADIAEDRELLSVSDINRWWLIDADLYELRLWMFLWPLNCIT